jgi:hypothetical protein
MNIDNSSIDLIKFNCALSVNSEKRFFSAGTIDHSSWDSVTEDMNAGMENSE